MIAIPWRRWPEVCGCVFFVAMMATGYYYNLTFVQFGLLDLGTRVLGMSEHAVALNMALLALVTLVVALAVGFQMTRNGWSESFPVKLRLAFASIAVQTSLTALAPFIPSPSLFTAWIAVAAVALGVGVPATFAATADLVRVRHRGYVAAAITAGAYFPAAVLSSTWTIEQFALQMIGPMIAGTIALGALAFGGFAFVRELGAQHAQPHFGRGRFTWVDRDGRPRMRRRLVPLIVFMFGIFFVDSLGFLRLADTPFIFQSAWQSPDLDPRLTIGAAHVLGAAIAGVLYSALGERPLFAWVFGIFALVHLMYASTLQMSPSASELPLAAPVLYAVAVSLYTVLNFALWADVSVPRTIARNAALGVALSGWTATFASTALALQMKESGLALEAHLRTVDALAMLFFLGALAVLAFAPGGRRARPPARQGGKP